MDNKAENHGEPWTDDDLEKVFIIMKTLLGPYSAWHSDNVPYADWPANKDVIDRIYPQIGAHFGRKGSAISWMISRILHAQERICIAALKAGFLTPEEFIDYLTKAEKIKVA